MATLNLRSYFLDAEAVHAVIGIAIFTAACSILFRFSCSVLVSKKYKHSSAWSSAVDETKDKSLENGNGLSDYGFESMGQIEPLKTLDWESEKPLRIYKFADKYNLTMGEH